jgi:hypothetical protein
MFNREGKSITAFGSIFKSAAVKFGSFLKAMSCVTNVRATLRRLYNKLPDVQLPPVLSLEIITIILATRNLMR